MGWGYSRFHNFVCNSEGKKVIKIKQHNDKWRIELENEEWQVNDIDKLEELMSKIIKLKKEYGQIK